MSFLGMLSLGLFVGGVIGLVMAADPKPSSTVNSFSAILGAAIGGGLGAFIQFIETPLQDEVYAYPMGLVLGFIWPFVTGSWLLVREEGGPKKHPLAVVHIAAVVLVTVLTFLLIMFPQVRGMLDAAQTAPS